MKNKVKVQDLYDITVRNYLPNKKENSQLYKSKKENLKNKFDFLMENIVFRNIYDYGTERKTMISEQDAVIVLELFKRSTGLNQQDIFVKWFNDDIYPDDYGQIIELSDKVNLMLNEIYAANPHTLKFENKKKIIKITVTIDISTCTKWNLAIKSALDYDTAIYMYLQKKRQGLRNSLLLLKPSVNFDEMGEFFSENEHKLHKGILTGFFKTADLENTLLPDSLATCYTQSDYLNLIAVFLELVEADVMRKAVHDIAGFAEGIEENGWKNITDAFQSTSLPSQELKRFHHIYKILKSDPEFVKLLEEKTNQSNLLDFFHIKMKKKRS